MRQLHRPGHTLEYQHHMHHHVHADLDSPSMVSFPA